MNSTIAILGTFDTKGAEHAFIAEHLKTQGFATLLIDVSSLADPAIVPDVSRTEVLAALDDPETDAILARQDRGECVTLMGRAAAVIVARLESENQIHGIISLGGGGGTAIATTAMRALPLGFPKLMVSTLASGQTAHYVGTSDITMMPAIVDVSGINRVSRLIFSNAAGAIAGMVNSATRRQSTSAPLDEKPLIVASMFGNTTECVTEAKRIMEAAGYEVLVFAATGSGGRAMESLIDSGLISGVLDITTTEWADELVGGVLNAGPDRLSATARAKIPAIVVPGCLDMVNFGERDSVPAQFADRNFYVHNEQVTLMRTNAAECTELGRILAEKINAYSAPVTVLIPGGGISVISAPGQPFHNPAADTALFESLKSNLRGDIPVIESEANINDDTFAQLCADTLVAELG